MAEEQSEEVIQDLNLSDIETTWRRRHDPMRFTMIYGPAVLRYLMAILQRCQQEQEADDVLQEILTQVSVEGFPNYDPARGPFRPYLKQMVRNAALKRVRQRSRDERTADVEQLAHLAPSESGEAEREWLEQWRTCVVEQALRALEKHQTEAGRGNLAYTVVRVSIDHPEADSQRLATFASEQSGQPLSPEAFRKQLSRARRTFAEFIVAEIQQTLDGASAEEVLGELAELGLLGYVRDYLPERP